MPLIEQYATADRATSGVPESRGRARWVATAFPALALVLATGWSPPGAGAAPAELPAAAPAVVVAPSGSADDTEGLDPMLALAYTMAQREAHAQDVPLSITSGYRTPAEQQQLWEEGIATYGSPEAARKWVLPPEESTHVLGRAIDVGPLLGAQWLEANGTRWGLCRRFDNEWWHFELGTAPGGVCPPLLPDAS